MNKLVAYLEAKIAFAATSEDREISDTYINTIVLVGSTLAELFEDASKHGISLFANRIALPIGAALGSSGIGYQSSATLIQALGQLIKASLLYPTQCNRIAFWKLIGPIFISCGTL